MTAVRLTTDRLVVRTAGLDDGAVISAFFRDNLEHLRRWEPPRPADFATEAHWRERLVRDLEEQERGVALRFLMCRRDDPTGAVIGTCNYTQIFRGPLLSCMLGYSIDGRHEGHGLMREALQASIPHMFDVVGLHRIQANYQPINERSGGLLRRLGFVVEGYARDYLFLNGAWRDDIMTSLINPRPIVPTV